MHRLNINFGVGFMDHEESDGDLGSGLTNLKKEVREIYERIKISN